MGIINKIFGASGGNTHDGQGEERSGGIDVIQNNSQNVEYVWKFPYNNIMMGAQLIVNQSQEVVFVVGGQLADVFGPGRHTLSTGNLPLLSRLINIPFGGKTPFVAEVWYIDKRPHRNLPFGTPSPLLVHDPYYGSTIPIKANGEYGMRITDASMFYAEVVGTQHLMEERDINKLFKAHIQRKLNHALSDFVNHGVRSLQLNSHLDGISKYVKQSLSEEVRNYGLEVVNFDLVEIVLDRTDPQVAAAFEREKKYVDMETESAALARKRSREGYTYQQERQLDVMETAAGNEGALGGTMGVGMGIGMGVGMGETMGAQMNKIAQNVIDFQPQYSCSSQQPSSISCEQAGIVPPPPIVQYYVLINNVQQGPWEVSHLQEMIQKGIVTSDTYVWKVGMKEWKMAKQCPDIAVMLESNNCPPAPPIL